MKRRYFKKRNLDDMNAQELCKYLKTLRHTRLKELYRFKQEAEDEGTRIVEKLKEVEKELQRMAAQAQIDREAVNDVPNGTSTLSLH